MLSTPNPLYLPQFFLFDVYDLYIYRLQHCKPSFLFGRALDYLQLICLPEDSKKVWISVNIIFKMESSSQETFD